MSEPTPKEQRGPTNLRIKFRSATLEQFIERYAADVSRGGIFIRTREPLAVGTQLRLELQLQDMTPLISGEGTVIWIRENDPARPTVPPGMAVRFDSVSADTQPTLDKILAEKARMEEVGKVPAQPTGGMAVRRPSAVMTPLDSAGRGSGGPSKAPSDQTGAGGWGPPPAPAPSSSAITRETPAMAVPEAARPSPPAPPAAPAPTKTSFLASRMTPGAGSPAAGPFTRARQTSTRPVPVPSALFEPPTAADIDKALSVLEEAPGRGPMPPMPSVPRFAEDNLSNEPTRVADSAETAAMAAEAGVELPAPATGSEAAAGEGEAQLPLVVNPVEVVGPGGDKGAVAAPAAPEVSRRFRAASKAYPTLQRRRGAGVVIALFLLIGAAAAAVWKLRPGSGVPPKAVTASATAIAPAAAPAPAPTPPPPAAEVAPPTPPPAPPPVVEEKKPAPVPAAAEKASDERGSHHASHRKGHEEASSGRSSGKENAGGKGPEVRAVAAKPAEATPAEPKAAEASPPAAEKPAPVEKPAPPTREAAAPAAEKPAEAKPTGGLLKITSSPPGADVTIDGAPVGSTPFTSKDIDPGTPHAITLKKDGFETHERMVGSSDWSRAHGSTPQSLKVNVKLRRVAGPPPADNPSGSPAEDTGGPYIKEVNPSTP